MAMNEKNKHTDKLPGTFFSPTKGLPVVLVIDDDGLDLWLPKLLLEPLGFKVFEADSVSKVNAALSLGGIDVVLVNLDMHTFDVRSFLDHSVSLYPNNSLLFINYTFHKSFIKINGEPVWPKITKPIKSSKPILILLGNILPGLYDILPPDCFNNLKRGNRKKKTVKN